MTKPTSTELRYAGLFRRLFAIFYDVFLLTAILFIVAAIAMMLNNGKAIETSDSFRPAYIIFMLSICYLYFSWFWIHGGQSLGMKTWRIQLQSCDPEQNSNRPIDWKISAIRFFSAIISWSVFGLGFLWAFFDKKNRCWHDLISKTVLIDLRNQK
jgi:uncharacterized RDD family membrane protein YckC